MDVILIACCSSKVQGGSASYTGSELRNHLPASSYQQLMAARRELAGLVDETPGPDLGGISPRPLAFLPAIERYNGILYRRSRVRELYPVSKDVKILIISALYGLLEANDPIRNYNHEMKETTKNGMRLYIWWKKRNLGKWVEEAILASQPSRIHCLLPKDYLKALEPWRPVEFAKRKIEYLYYDHPGLGIAILDAWGKDLERILLRSQ